MLIFFIIKEMPAPQRCLEQSQIPLQCQATASGLHEIYTPQRSITQNVKELCLTVQTQYRCAILQFQDLTMEELNHRQWVYPFYYKSDLFDQILKQEESSFNYELSFYYQRCEDQSMTQETSRSVTFSDFIGDPVYFKKAEPIEPPSQVTTPGRSTQLDSSPKLAKEENQTRVETQEAQISVSERDSSSSEHSHLDDEKRKYLMKKEKKEKKGKKEKKEPYPTKNFLPSFRSSFLNYIKRHYKDDDQFLSFQIIRRIKSKSCINLKDYEDLFKQKEFRPILKEYFENQVIMRDLMMSRIDYDLKMEYMGRIHVFQEAYETGVFNRIN